MKNSFRRALAALLTAAVCIPGAYIPASASQSGDGYTEDFEARASLPDGWNGEASVSDGKGLDGSRALQFTSSAKTASKLTSPSFTVTSDSVYELSFFVKIDGDADAYIYADAFSSSGKKLSGTRTYMQTGEYSEQLKPVRFAVNVSSSAQSVYLVFTTGGGSASYYIDDIAFVKADGGADCGADCGVYSPFDGISYPGGWYADNSLDRSGGLYGDTEYYHSGSSSARLTLDNLSDSYVVSSFTADVNSGGKYELSLWYLSANAYQTDMRPVAVFYNAAGSECGSLTGGYYKLNAGTALGGWMRAEVEFTVPDGAVSVGVRLLMSAGRVSFWFDDVSVRSLSSGCVDYCDFHAVDQSGNISGWTADLPDGSNVSDGDGLKLTGSGVLSHIIYSFISGNGYTVGFDYFSGSDIGVKLKFYDYNDEEITAQTLTYTAAAGADMTFSRSFTSYSCAYAALELTAEKADTYSLKTQYVLLDSEKPDIIRDKTADYTQIKVSDTPITSEIKDSKLYINGEIYSPVFYLRPDNAALFSETSHRDMAQSGIELYISYEGWLDGSRGLPIWNKAGAATSLANGGFETGDKTGWGTGYKREDDHWSIVSSEACGGNYSMAATNDAGTYMHVYSNQYTVRANTTYIISYAYKNPDGADVKPNLYDFNTSADYVELSRRGQTDKNGWVHVTTEYTTGYNTFALRFDCFHDSGKVCTVFWDDVSITEKTDEPDEAEVITEGILAGTYIDYDAFDYYIYQTLYGNDSALVMINIDFTAPSWWLSDHPDQAVVTSEGSVLDGVSFASTLFREQAGEVLKLLLVHCKSMNYYNRVYGIRLTAGRTYEFMTYGGGDASLSVDYSAAALEGFRAWAKAKYKTVQELQSVYADDSVTFETLSLPTYKELQNVKFASKSGYIYDASIHRRLIDFNLFLSEASADSLLYWAGLVKAGTDDKLIVGTYNGYLWNANSTDEIGTAHTSIQRVMQSDFIDFIASPFNYGERNLSQDYAYMAMADSARAYGKLYILEADIRTCLAEPSGTDEFNYAVGNLYTMTDTLDTLKNVFAKCLADGCGIWLYDMIGGWFDDEQILSLTKDLKGVYDGCAASDADYVSEVAVIIGDDTCAYTSRNNYNIYNTLDYFYRRMRLSLSQLGCSYDLYQSSTLSDGLVPEHKVYIFLTPFELDEAERAAIDALKANGHTLLFFYLSGYSDTSGSGADNISSLTGIKTSLLYKDSYLQIKTSDGYLYGNTTKSVNPIPYITDADATVLGNLTANGEAGFVKKSFDGWTSVYSAAGAMPQELLRAILSDAGVHSFTSDASVVVHSNSLYLTLTDAQAGTSLITLPEGSYKVTNELTGEVLLEDGNSFNWVHRQNETVILTYASASSEPPVSDTTDTVPADTSAPVASGGVSRTAIIALIVTAVVAATAITAAVIIKKSRKS